MKNVLWKYLNQYINQHQLFIGGGILGGPVGGVIGAVLADSTMSLAEHKPVGVIDHTLYFSNASSSDTVDVILDLTLAGVGNIGAKQVTSNTLDVFKYSVPIIFKKTTRARLNSEILKKNHYNNRNAPLATPDCFKDFDKTSVRLVKQGSTISEKIMETGETAGHMVHPHGSNHAPVQATVNLKNGSEKETDEIVHNK